MLLETVYDNLQQKYSFQLVAGIQNTNRKITWYHIIENTTLAEFIRGNELIFITGVGFIGEDWLVSYIKELIKYNACGLVVCIGPYIKAIPQCAIDICNSNSFPLFTIPWEFHLVDITRDLSQLIIEDELILFQLTTAMKNIVTNTNKEESIIQLTEIGYRKNSGYCIAQVACFDSGWKKDKTLDIIQDFMLLNCNGIAFCLKSNIVIVYVGSTKEGIRELTQSLRAELKKYYPIANVYIGVGNRGQGLSTVPDSYKQAMNALSVAVMSETSCVFYESIGLYKLLFAVEDQSVLAHFVDDTLGKIIHYDKTNNTDYLKWLNQYLRCDGSVQRVSEETFCHRNTVNYKMRKIRELFGLDTDSNAQKAAIIIALHIVDIINIQTVEQDE